MRILLVYPQFPLSYWGFQHSMKLVGKAASLPPLGLLTVAALLPARWSLRCVDLNVEPLTDQQLLWADQVFISGMRIQAQSMHEIIARARALGRPTVVGGPAASTAPEDYLDADLVFSGEAEGRIDALVRAMSGESVPRDRILRPCAATAGGTSRAADRTRPALDQSPTPRFDLVDLSRYTSASVQFSRGCPFNCEFCDIIEIYGRRPRVKTAAQVLAELDRLYALGFRRSVFIVDDNFIGNRAAARGLLAALGRWQRTHGYPFELYTEASVNLATDAQMVRDMVEAGFSAVFLGIETPDAESLASAQKVQNTIVDLRVAVDTLTSAGLEVMGGFIVGFDTDTAAAFDAQREFIASVPVPLAMVGLLSALPGTQLWRRLEREGRLRHDFNGDQLERPNFEPVMDEEALLRGYAELLAEIYSPRAYYARCRAYVERAPATPGRKRTGWQHAAALVRATLKIGLRGPARREYWRLFAYCVLHARHAFAGAIGHAIMGEHMIRYTREEVLPRIERALRELRAERQRAAAAVAATAERETRASAGDARQLTPPASRAPNADFERVANATWSS
ncbi:MAG: B12-binding domain-containing radical SAM protein [Myxococcales bacterium]|nr:B12-binding domain-containing radical SAM protein [Myxococcales bacterium]